MFLIQHIKKMKNYKYLTELNTYIIYKCQEQLKILEKK